jgi:hypothetical protein
VSLKLPDASLTFQANAPSARSDWCPCAVGAFQSTVSATLKRTPLFAPDATQDFMHWTLAFVTLRIVLNSIQLTGPVPNAKVPLHSDSHWFKTKACVLLTNAHLTNWAILSADHANPSAPPHSTVCKPSTTPKSACYNAACTTNCPILSANWSTVRTFTQTENANRALQAFNWKCRQDCAN